MRPIGTAARKRRILFTLACALFLLFVFSFLSLPFSAATAPAEATGAGDGSAENPFSDPVNDFVNFPVYPADSGVLLNQTAKLVDDFSLADNPYAEVILRVCSMQPTDLSGEPGDIILLIDCSLSMTSTVNGEARMSIVKRSAIEFTQKLLANPGDDLRIGIIAFGTDSRLVCSPTSDFATVSAAIESLAATESFTRMSQAFRDATSTLQAGGRGKQHIVALTDGEVTSSDRASTQNAAAQAANAGINIYTIGFTHTDAMLEGLVAGSGFYQSALDASGLQAVFNTIATSLLAPNTEGLVTDVIAPEFEPVPNSEEHPWRLSVGDAEEADPAKVVWLEGNTLQWIISTLPSEATLHFYVRVTSRAPAGTEVAVSEDAKLFYNNYLGSYCLLSFPEAVLPLPLIPSSSSGSSSSSSSSSAGAAAGGGQPAEGAPPASPGAGGTGGIAGHAAGNNPANSLSESGSTPAFSASISMRTPVPIPPESRAPIAPPLTDGWSFTNLLLAFVSACISCILFVSLFSRKNLETQPVHRIRPPWKVLAVLLGVASVVVLFVTQDFSLPVLFADSWSLWAVVLLAAQFIAMLIGYATRNEVYE